jgi:predicted Zn-dependent peptidase
MKKRFSLLLAAGMFCIAANPASHAVTPELPVIDYTEYDLPNGLHVILHQDKSAPVVSTYLLYHVGSKNEQADRTGFAHFFEHLMFEGTANIKRGQIDKLISAAGGNLNASTSFDRTEYHFNVPSNQLALALWIDSDRMLQAKVEDVGVETQRQVVKEERRLGTDNAPFGTVFENLAAQVFEGTPYAWTPIGSVQYIDQAKLEEFRDFYHHYYVPNNATLAVAGDIDIEKTKKLISDYFAGIPRGGDIERPKFELGSQAEPKTRTVELPTTPLPATIHSWRGPQEISKDAPALELLTDILATGRSSRLYERLVRGAQVASDIDVFPYLLENGGVLGIFVVGNPDTPLDKLDSLIDAEVTKVRDSGVSDEELQKAKNQELKELASAYSTMQSRAEKLAHFHVMYGDTGQINKQMEWIQAVTKADVQRVAQQYFTTQGVNILHYPVVKSSPNSKE